MKITHQLLKFNSDPKFWDYLNLGFSLNSLAFFMSTKGKEILNKAVILYNYTPPVEQKKYEVSNQKFGQDKIIEKKPKTLIDLLDQ